MRTLILALGFISFTAVGSTCEQIYSETPLITAGLIESAPVAAQKMFKNAVIKECEAAYSAGAAGVSFDLVTGLVMSSVDMKSPGYSSALVATRLQIVSLAWAAGVESK
ncbi:hypothetical protein MLO98_23690 [Escherichia coli]|nr:hypothetical protein [Escherichia coli]